MGLYKIGQAGVASSTTTTVNLPANAATDYDSIIILGRVAGGGGEHRLRLNSHTTYYRINGAVNDASYTAVNTTSSETYIILGSTIASNGYLGNFWVEINNLKSTEADCSGVFQYGLNQLGSTGYQRWGAFGAYGFNENLSSITFNSSTAPTYGIFYIYGLKNG